jgi:nitronate monooxygenase
MRMIALAQLAVQISAAGGIGFIGSGNDQSNLDSVLSEAVELCKKSNLPISPVLPVGVGFLNWGADLEEALRCIAKYKPCAIWLFAPRDAEDLGVWTKRCREANGGETKVWIQVGGVEEARKAIRAAQPDVLVVQGGDAGGHGLNSAASIVPLVPEVTDAVAELQSEGIMSTIPSIIATGGIADGRGVAAALALGAQGVCLGTRLLAAREAVVARGYRAAVLRASDGGQTTARSSVYDRLRGTTDWPREYGGRGVLNQSYHDAQAGMDWEENTRRYNEAVKLGDAGWGDEGRMTTYAGTGVGLVKREQGAAEIVEEIRNECLAVIERLQGVA